MINEQHFNKWFDTNFEVNPNNKIKVHRKTTILNRE